MVLDFILFKTVFFLLFLISRYKIVDSMNICQVWISMKSLITNFGTVTKNPEMLKFVPDHLRTKKMCKHAVKKLPYLLRYVPNRYKTKKMCDKPILENGGTLKYVPDC